MPQFTPTQGRYLSFIHAYIEATGQPPSMQDIADAMRVSPPSVNNMLKSLEKKGLIARQAGVARSIELLVDTALLPRWKKKISCSFQIWAPKDASQDYLDRCTEQIIAHRKEKRELERQSRKVV